MLSLLPPELLRQIIESTIPHTFHSATYQARQNTLCALSLVSKQFYAIAQPLLLEIVWVKSLEKADHLFLCGGGGNARGKSIRWAVVELDEQEDASSTRVSREEVEYALQRFSSAKSLVLVNDSETVIDLSFLSSFQSMYTAPSLITFN
jgi:hypothetical protein